MKIDKLTARGALVVIIVVYLLAELLVGLIEKII